MSRRPNKFLSAWAPQMFDKIPVSAYIITLNEARNIGVCLDRLIEFDEVILVDSGSTDGTVELAEQYENVQASYHAWNGFSEQKAHALSLCRNDWVLNIDADEIVTDAYLEEIMRVVSEDEADALDKLADFEALLIMRERTPITKNLIENLTKLKFIITSGLKNKSIDLETAKKRKIIVSGTESNINPVSYTHLTLPTKA